MSSDDELLITEAMVDDHAPLTQEYFDAIWRGAAAQLRREVEAEVRDSIADRLTMRLAKVHEDARRDPYDQYYVGMVDALIFAQQAARGELDS